MKIKCSACHKVYDINEELLPDGKKLFKLPCPRCNSLIHIDRQSDLENIGSGQSHVTEKSKVEQTDNEALHPEELIRGKELREKILFRLKSLPAMPQVVLKARQVMKNPKLGVRHLAQVMDKDPAMVVKILKTANSAYYGVTGTISSIQSAIALVGERAVEEIIVMSVSSGFLDRMLEGYGLRSTDMWKHSLAVAFGSQIIAGKKVKELENSAFFAGLLHDVGKIVLDKYIYERKEMFEEFLVDGQQTFLNAESNILGFDHSQIGFEMCKAWGMSKDLIAAVKFHHYPSRSNNNKLAYIVHVADCISILSGFAAGSGRLLYQMEKNAMAFLGLQEGDLRDTMCQAVEAVQKTEEEMPVK